MECVESGRRREDVAPVHWRVHQAGLHRWRPGLSTALQRPVRPDDIVRAAQAVDVPVELVGATGVAGRATAHVRRAWANRAGETLDERGVQGLGILRLPQRSLQPTRRADPPAPFDSDDAIVPPSLEHWTIDARRPKEALNHPNGVLAPIGRGQRESHHPSARRRRWASVNRRRPGPSCSRRTRFSSWRESMTARCCWVIQPATATTRNCNTWGKGDIRGEPSRGSRRSRTSRPGERPA